MTMAPEKRRHGGEQHSITVTDEEIAWLPSRILFAWATPMFKRANQLAKEQKALEMNDLLELPSFDHGEAIGMKFEHAWEEAVKVHAAQQKTAKGSSNATTTTTTTTTVAVTGLPDATTGEYSTTYFKPSVKAILGRRFVVAGMMKAVNSCMQFSFPILINQILQFIEETSRGEIQEDDPWGVYYRGYWLSLILLCTMAGKAFIENLYFHRVFRCAYQTRVAISVAVYNKSLRLANAERQSTTLGELINLMQVDATKIEQFVPQLHVLWDGLLQIAGYMTILYTLIGWSCFAGLVVMVLAIPVQGKIMGKLYGYNRHMVKYTDDRVKITNEAVQGVQCVKMYCWEDSFEHEISKRREQELQFLKGVAYLRGFSRAYMGALPGIVAVTSFVVYALAIGKDISASTLFSALVAFEQIRFPLLFYPSALALLAQARVSAARVEAFLKMKEVGGNGEGATGDGNYVRDKESTAPEIHVQDATIYWNDPKQPLPDDYSQQSGDDSTSIHSRSTKVEDDATMDPEKKIAYPKAILNNVTFHVQTGELCAVVGRVASGKSTLCSAILNETILGSGSVTLKGRVAYAAQSPWILNATLRDNILFGQPMDQDKYNRVIRACQLTHDLAMLEDGDLTEIGEKGINLSGGQKQRVSIARAAYSDADVIILDDPLSALDPEVGKKLFEECFVDLMAGKTRLFVTNQLQFLRQCDKIVALGKHQVLEQGTYDDLMSDENGEINRLLKDGINKKKKAKEAEEEMETKAEAEATDGGDKDAKSSAGPAVVAPDAKKLMTKEERSIGAVSLTIYKKYLEAGGGLLRFSFVFLVFVLGTLITIANSAWVSFWTSDTGYETNSEAFYLGIYAALAVSLGVFQYFRTFLLAQFGVNSSFKLHSDLVTSIFQAPQSFFDTTPVGRILSRFSKDLYSIDVELVEFLDFFLAAVLSVLSSIATIIYVTPWFGIAVLPLGVFYFHTLQYFRNVSRETKRLDSLSRSPVYAQFSETLGGLTTIRAYGGNARFMIDFEDKIDQNTRAFYCNKAADRWLSTRLELIGAIIGGLTAFFASNVAINDTGNGGNFASLAGLSMTLSIGLTGVLNWAVRTFAQLENGMNACERVLYYTEEIPQEAPRTSDDLQKIASSCSDVSRSDPAVFAVVSSNKKTAEIPAHWPPHGQIVLKNLKMRYRPETPLVLKGLNLTITGGQKIGVVGRTGSGKSSLILSLLRLVEPSLVDCTGDYDAPLVIDGVDVLRVGLKELRSRIGIIPQNPVLFSGTVRSNVDPFEEYSDEQIWYALERCGLKESVEMMPGMLLASVAEYGENLSAGMRQMLVLGRALLKECRILLLDEATSSVDYETDQEIQRTIRQAFVDCTVLTIAHRINTIMDSDKILVMKDGLVEEFASPEELLKDEGSTFSEIVRQAKAGGH